MKRLYRSLVLLICLGAAGCGHTLKGLRAPTHAVAFDFSDPLCELPKPDLESGGADQRVVLRFLGVSGLYLEWNEVSLLAGPFFSNPERKQLLFGTLDWKEEEIDKGLEGIVRADLDAILVGHSHHDHLADVPALFEGGTLRTRVLANETGRDILAAWGVEVATVNQSAASGEPIWLHDRLGARLPLRIFAVPAKHAPHIGRVCLLCGRRKRALNKEETPPRLCDFKAGNPHAFVLDLMDTRDTVRFRIFYQDTASPACIDKKKKCWLDTLPEAPIDLAIVAMTSSNRVRGHPAELLRQLNPRHVLVTHYEDFMRPRDEPLRFLSTQAQANRFFTQMLEALDAPDSGQPPGRPENATCGPKEDRWTLPFPGDWLIFRPAA